MTRRLIKEIRLLAPWPLAATGLLFVAGPFVELRRGVALGPLLFLLLAVFVPAARAFGSELDLGTMERLLSQPLDRRRIWQEKLLALLLTTAPSLAALQLARRLFYGPDTMGLDLILCLLALTGGPLMSLYFRQSFLGLCAAITLPGVAIWLWVFLLYAIEGDFRAGLHGIHLPPMLVYAPLALVIGRRFFLGLELEHGTSPSIGLRRSLRSRTKASQGPTFRLFMKELQVQAPNLAMIPGALVLWGVLATLGRFSTDVTWLGPLAVLSATPSALLLLIFPLMLGATAVSAEREIGVVPWHASLPVSRARQWAVKVVVVACFAAAGSLLAVALDRALVSILEARRTAIVPLAESVMWVPLLSLAAGLYASARARDPMRALMGALALLVVALVPLASSTVLAFRGDGLGTILLPDYPSARLYLAVTVPALVLVASGFSSFRPEPWHAEERGWRALSSLVLLGALLTIGFW